MANDRTRDLAHRLRQALGDQTSTNAERVLHELMRDDMVRNEIFLRLQDDEREPLHRLWENFGPGPRITHHAAPGFQPRVRWHDQTTAMRRGALRAALAREFGDATASPNAPPFDAIKKGAAAKLLGMRADSFSKFLADVKRGEFPAWAHEHEEEVKDLLCENSLGQLERKRIETLVKMKTVLCPTKR